MSQYLWVIVLIHPLFHILLHSFLLPYLSEVWIYFFKPIESNLFLPYTLGCMIIYWIVDNVPEATIINKTDSLFPISFSPRGETHAHLHPSYWDFVWIELKHVLCMLL